MIIQGVHYPSDFEAKKAMIDIGCRMDEKGYIVAGDGSMSVRVGPNAIWITIADADKGALAQDSFVRMDLNGKHMPGMKQIRLPEDLSIHLKIYAENPAIRGILHAYPIEAVALAAQGYGAEAVSYTPALRKLGQIPLVKEVSLETCAQNVAACCKSGSGILFPQDGCMVWDESILGAFHRLETLEYGIRVRKAMGAGIPSAHEVPSVSAAPVPVLSDLPIEGLTPLIRPAKPYMREEAGMPKETGMPKEAEPSQRERMMAEVVRRSLSAMR